MPSVASSETARWGRLNSRAGCSSSTTIIATFRSFFGEKCVADAKRRRGLRSSGSSLKFELGDAGGEFGPVACADFPQRVSHVSLDGLARQEQLLGDLRVAGAPSDQTHYLPLTRRQRLGGRATPPGAYAERPQSLLGDLPGGGRATRGGALGDLGEQVLGLRAVESTAH